MAGFQVSIYGRFWVSTKESEAETEEEALPLPVQARRSSPW